MLKNILNDVDTLFREPLTGGERKEVDAIVHFYFCLIVALKINHRYCFRRDNHSRLLFLKKWLSNSQEKKIFNRHLLEDISWIKSEINGGRNYSEIENIIFVAYGMFFSLQKQNGERCFNDSE